MHPNNKKEQFSKAYLLAVAAKCGCTPSQPEVDDDSTDMILKYVASSGELKHITLDVQLKCTAATILKDQSLNFPLPIKNYNELRESCVAPRILVVVCVPENEEDWLTQTEEQLILKKCGYWFSLKGLPDRENENTVTITIPRANQVTPKVLAEIMERVSRGEDI